MFQKKKGVDIVMEIGGITTTDAAMALFEEQMDKRHFSRIQQIKNPEAILKIANAMAMCEPDTIYINTGSDEDRRFIRDWALKNGEESVLPISGHTIHYDLKEEQARIIDRTFYIANKDETTSSLAKRIERADALIDVGEKMKGIMQGMMMMVGFYIRGPVGAPVSNPALEITSSAYVSHSAEILYRNAYQHFDRVVAQAEHFFTNIHSQGLNRPEDLPHARVYMDRSHQTTYSMLCTYAGNTLLLKKGNHRFAVDRSVYERPGQEIAEHMFITGIAGPGDRITFCAGAAPSGCGKTTTAMAGDSFIGDDLAQLWIAEDGSIRSINPEVGIFGIVEDVNWEGDPKLMECLRHQGTEVIWSNVLIDENGVPQWIGNGEDPPPQKGVNFQGEWVRGMLDGNGNEIPMSHPNSRCTLSNSALGNYSELNEDPNGVETRVITYSGRDSDTMPPVWVAKSPEEGVVIGANLVSAATATEIGATGVRRQPWANEPFIPGALGDYMKGQFVFFGSDRIASDKQPVMAGLNYFLTHAARGGTSTKLLGEKKDVKAWMAWLERRAHKEVEAIETPIGYLPKFKDLERLFKDIIEKDYSQELYLKQFSLYIDNIIKRIDLQLEAYGKEKNIPERLFEIFRKQKGELSALKENFGPVVTPAQLEEIQNR